MIINKYLSQFEDLPSRCAFRGHASVDWGLHSAATRRLLNYYSGGETDITPIHLQQIYTIYHRVILLEPSRTKGFGVEYGSNISDLQLLAKLQHFGAATGLLDFTWDPMISLWFACQSSLNDTERESDGVLYCIDLNNPVRFRELTTDEESQSVEGIFLVLFKSEKQLYWEPVNRGDASPRIFRQQSVFVIENPISRVDPSRVITISALDKEGLLKELRNVFNIDRGTVYADIQGFSRANSPSSPIERIESPTNYLIQGNRFYQQGDFSNAISSYSRCIELDSDASETYHLRGNARTELKDYDGAINDFSLAIQYQNRPYHHWQQFEAVPPHVVWPLYYNRGNVRFAQREFEGALSDFDWALQLCQQANQDDSAIFLNRGNTKCMLCRFEEAMEDFAMGARHGFLQALFNKGNTLVLLGQVKEAIQSYDEVSVMNPNYPGLQSNRIHAHSILHKLQMGHCEIFSTALSELEGLFRVTIFVTFASLGESNAFQFMLSGNTGNNGNVGGHAMPGTAGYLGLPNVLVQVNEKFDPSTFTPSVQTAS